MEQTKHSLVMDIEMKYMGQGCRWPDCKHILFDELNAHAHFSFHITIFYCSSFVELRVERTSIQQKIDKAEKNEVTKEQNPFPTNYILFESNYLEQLKIDIVFSNSEVATIQKLLTN